MGIGKVRREGAAGDLHDLQGAHDAPPVAGQDRPRRLGVDGGQAGVQRSGAPLLQLGLQSGPHLGVGAGEVQGVDRGAHIEARAADEHGAAPGGEQAVDLEPGQALVLGDTGRLRDVPDVQEVVRDAVPLLLGELGGADVHAAVQLHGVGVDHLTVQGPGQGDTEVGLAAWAVGPTTAITWGASFFTCTVSQIPAARIHPWTSSIIKQKRSFQAIPRRGR